MDKYEARKKAAGDMKKQAGTMLIIGIGKKPEKEEKYEKKEDDCSPLMKRLKGMRSK